MKSLIVVILLVSSPALGMVYMWNDSNGIAHYTNREYDIPASYRSRAKALYPETTDSRSGSPGNPGEQKSPDAVPTAVAAAPQRAPSPMAVVQKQVQPPVAEAQLKNIPERPPRTGRKQRVRSSSGGE